MKKIILGALLTSLSVSAFAESGFSSEVLLGTADQKSSIKNFGSTSGDDTSLGLRGIYTLNQNIGFELSYQDYGQTNDRYIDEWGDTITDKVSTTAFNLGVKGIIPLDNNFSMHGRLGLSTWDVELEETDSFYPGQVFKVDDSGTDFYYGVGLQYGFSPHFQLGAEYTITNMDASLANVSVDHEVKNLAFSLSYSY